MILPLADLFGFHPLSIVGTLILAVVVAAGVALVCIALKVFGLTVPEWFRQVCWVVVAAFVVITAIRLVASF